ncbi:uracil-DNA glycosylase family protein [Massilia psychrophila]|uniref:Uracil-DNA glycosylase n=1 Tax=Massilia psychrophila TaxID=1603353 RepID=A0A2G8SZI8_9BURK|nr:uracil-DNA glycosylase family protein [Massilia psychrophila]PIL39184.1 hypothetical protein CR103_13930 [Massilia psychrophila]GGE82284.1 uracil-DNA glycosylase [Massilia psychrophila]
MQTLQDQLREYLAGWRNDMSPAWDEFFAGIEPDLEAVDSTLLGPSELPVIPGRRGKPLAGAPEGAHVFRAFDDIVPARVRVVVIGQDPYPRVTRATGRAFEDGALIDWSGEVAVSLQRVVQSALAYRYRRLDFATGPGGWAQIQSMLVTGALALEPQRDFFDRLQRQGVLFVNASWTLTRFMPGGAPEQVAQVAMWRPMVRHLIQGLIERRQGVVFLLLGAFAQGVFAQSGGGGVEQDGAPLAGFAAVRHPHPNAKGACGYFSKRNPLAQVNARLTQMSQPSIEW